MNIPLFGAAFAALVIALPYLLQYYIARLPAAPACPSCRAVTRETSSVWLWLDRFPSLATTYIGECNRCGWRGRLRWRWAARRVRGDD
jgi:hypothetical protein